MGIKVYDVEIAGLPIIEQTIRQGSTSAISGDGVYNAVQNIPKVSGSYLTITFDSAFAGQVATVTGEDEVISVYVPASAPYVVACNLTYTSTTYTISCEASGVTYNTTVATGEYYNSLSATLLRSTLTISFAAYFAGKTYTITHGGSLFATGNVPSGSPYQVVVGVVPASGSYTISCDGFSVETNAPEEQGQNTDVTLNYIDSVLNNNSFEVIKAVSDAGTGPSYWSVGDRKGVVLNGSVGYIRTVTLSGTWYMSILGFDHNKNYESPYAHTITFQFGWSALTGGTQIAFCVDSSSSGVGMCMNSTNENEGGWPQSLMRNTICRIQFLACLPAELQSILKEVTKCTNTGNAGGSNTESSKDTIFLASETEIFGTNSGSGTTNNQVQYDYYKGVSAGATSKNAFAAASKIRYNHNSQSSATDWWERSPRSSTVNTFCCVQTSGSIIFYTASTNVGFAPCLCI